MDLLLLPNDLTAMRQGNRIVLSAGAGAAAVPHLGLRPGSWQKRLKPRVSLQHPSWMKFLHGPAA